MAQFLPTLFAGGRFATLATETLSLAGGGDRRIIGVFGFALAALPFVGFALALPQPPGASVTAGRCGSVTDARAAPEAGAPPGRRQRPARRLRPRRRTGRGDHGHGSERLRSSLLGYVCGTLEPVFEASGEVWLDGVAIHELPLSGGGSASCSRTICCFLTCRSARTWRSLPPAVRGRRERRARIEAALAEADLAGFARRDPATLSGGERARGPDAHAAAEPRALLLDEPFGKLDRPLRDRFRRFVFEHARAAGLPTLLVTHDEADAEAAAGAVVAFPEAEPAALHNVVPMPGIGAAA